MKFQSLALFGIPRLDRSPRVFAFLFAGVMAVSLLPKHVLAEDGAPLADAIERQDETVAAERLDKNADVNSTQADGTTPLHWAVYHDQTKLAERLIDLGADVKAANRYGVTALSLACQNGNGEIVQRLLKEGADPNAERPGGETALMTAARTGIVGPVEALLKSGAEVNAKDRHQQTAIMWAAAEGHAEVVKMLIDAKAEYQTALDTGFTPFLFAVRGGHQECAKTFLDAGVDVNAVMRPNKRVRKGAATGSSALTIAIENAHFELAAFLLRAGADPNDQRSGHAPLHQLTWVRKPNRGDGDDGDPPPRGTGEMTSLDFVRVLVEHGADVNLRLKRGKTRGRVKQRGMTPFMLAADTADLPYMKLLVELGADDKTPNVDGTTPLMVAAGLGTNAPGEEAGTEDESIEAVEYLLERGADINTVDKNGETAMHGAAYASFPQMVELLAKNGADIKLWNQKNKYGWTPLLIAQGHRPGNFKPAEATIKAVAKVMRAAGVEPDLTPTPREKRKGYEKN